MHDATTYERTMDSYNGSPDIRERLVSGGTPAIADFELVAAILGTGSRGKDVRVLAAEILAASNFSAGVPGIKELIAIPGVGQARALQAGFRAGTGQALFWSTGTQGQRPRRRLATHPSPRRPQAGAFRLLYPQRRT